MGPLVFICALLTPAESGAAPHVAPDSTLSTTERAALRAGYQHFLRSPAPAAESERGFAQLMQLREFRDVFAHFDEALAGDPDLQTGLDAMYRHLLSRPDSKQAVETLFRHGARRGPGQADAAEALRYLRIQPEQAERLTESGAARQRLPDVVRRALPALEQGPGGLEGLAEALKLLNEDEDARERVIGFWKMLAERAGAGEAIQDFESHLEAYPARFWVWHRRNLELAGTPDTRDWNRFWHRVARRDPEGETWYRGLVDSVTPTSQGEVAAAPWPPPGRPRALTPLSRPVVHAPDRPGVAGASRPTPPERPLASAPARPTPPRPSRPQPAVPQ